MASTAPADKESMVLRWAMVFSTAVAGLPEQPGPLAREHLDEVRRSFAIARPVKYPGDIKPGMRWRCRVITIGKTLSKPGMLVDRPDIDTLELKAPTEVEAMDIDGVLNLVPEGHDTEFAPHYAYKPHDGGKELYYKFVGGDFPKANGAYVLTQSLHIDDKGRLYAEVSHFSDTAPKRGLGTLPEFRPKDIPQWGFVSSYNVCEPLKP